jgi:hypothetical protein
MLLGQHFHHHIKTYRSITRREGGGSQHSGFRRRMAPDDPVFRFLVRLLSDIRNVFYLFPNYFSPMNISVYYCRPFKRIYIDAAQCI